MRRLTHHPTLAVGVLVAFALTSAAASGRASDDRCSLPAEMAAVRPDPEGTPTSVAIGLYVIDVMAIHDAQQSFETDFYFVMVWHDPRLSADRRGGSLEGCRLRLEDVWDPRTDIVNRRDLVHSQEPTLVIDAEGRLEYRQRLQGELQASLDVREFPFDRQALLIEVASFGYTPEEVAFAVERRTGALPDFSVAGWSIDLGEPRFGTEHIAAVDRRFARLDFVLEAQRHSGFYFWKMLLPLSLIVSMAWAVFWIDPAHLAPQVGVSTATVFTLIAFQFSLGHLLPRVSYLTRADHFLLGAMFLVFLALGEAVATGKLAGDGREALARSIDRWSRVVYAVLFLLLLLATFQPGVS